MIKILPLFAFIALLPSAYATQVLAENDAPQVVIPGYKPPGERSQPANRDASTTQTIQKQLPLPTPKPKPAPLAPSSSMPTQTTSTPAAPVFEQTIAEGLSLPSLTLSGQPIIKKNAEFYRNLSECTPSKSDTKDTWLQILGWEKGRCHLQMKSRQAYGMDADCYLGNETLYNIDVTVKAYQARSSPHTYQNVTWIMRSFKNECQFKKKPN